MAELLNTKINGTLNVNDYFNIDENGNLTLKLKNETENKLTINSNDLVLNTNFKMQSGTAFLNIIKIKYDDNNIILDANKDGIKINSYDVFDNKLKDLINIYKRSSQYAKNAGIKLYGDLFVYNGYNEIFNINNNDKTTSIRNAKILNLSNSEKYLMNYKNLEKTAKAKLANSSYNKFTLTNGNKDYSSFTKNNKIEIKEVPTGKKFITTIKEKEYIAGTTTTTEESFTTDIPFYDINDLTIENPDLENAILNKSDIIVKAYFNIISENGEDISEIQLSSDNQYGDGGTEAYILINITKSNIYNYYGDIIRITDPTTDEEILKMNNKYHNFNGNLIIRTINNENGYDNTFETLEDGNVFILTNNNFYGRNGNSYDLKFIYNYTTTVGEKYNIITNDYAAGFADYSKSLDLTIRKIYDYIMFDIQKNDSSIFNITGEDVNINKPVIINSDTTINTEYSGITINDNIFDTIFNYNLVLKKPSTYINVSNDENWYLINNKYSSYNIGSQVRINDIVHNIELRDAYSGIAVYPSIRNNPFIDVKGKVSVSRTPDKKLLIYNHLDGILEVKGNILTEGIGKKPKIQLFIKLTDYVASFLETEIQKELKQELPSLYIHFIYNDINKIINVRSSAEVIIEEPLCEFGITDLYESNIISPSTDPVLQFQSYQINKVIIFKDNYKYKAGDKIYYREPTNSYNLLNINTRKSSNFLTIKTDNQINVDGKLSAKELYDNGNRVYTTETFDRHLYETFISIDITKSTVGTGALYQDENGNDLTFNEIHLRAKRILPDIMKLKKYPSGSSNGTGIKFIIGKNELNDTDVPFDDRDLVNSYLIDSENINSVDIITHICDIYSIEISNSGISSITYKKIKSDSAITKLTRNDEGVFTYQYSNFIKPTNIKSSKGKPVSLENGNSLYYLFPWYSGNSSYSVELDLGSSPIDRTNEAVVMFYNSNSNGTKTNANMRIKISINNRKIY